MKKRVLTIFCVVVMLAVLFTTSTLQASAATGDFQVGFARVDINPYKTDGVFSSGIMELPLSGNGDVWNRLSTDGLIDDNGDGKITADDGLAATCIAITDANGQTVLLITADLIDGYLGSKVRTAIVSRVNEALSSGELSNVKLAYNQIYYAGTHTHNAPDVPSYSASGKTGTNSAGKSLSTINSNLGIWIDRTVEDIADAAILALKDRASAKITKDAISASEDTRSPVSGKVLNTVRHYYNSADGCYAGDNFNDRGSNPKQVTQVNDTLYLLKFDFSDHNSVNGDTKLPILLANWRGHATLNNNDGDYSSRNSISSDYYNAFRHALEYNCTVYSDGTGTYSSEKVYRVALFNGEGGNVNTWGREISGGKETGAWIGEFSTQNKECRGNGYGRILCALAKHGLQYTQGNEETVAAGEIRTVRYDHYYIQNDSNTSALAYEAAKAFQATSNPKLPYVYKSSNNEVFVIGSRYQANYLVSRWNTQYQMPVDDRMRMELGAILIGEDLAFVTIPGEPFDYYYNEDGTNAWKNLVSDTYGRPFVLGYCNGSLNYIPNDRAYTYNSGSKKWQTGSYEASIAYVPQGTGEHMIELFGKMLDMAEAGEHNGVKRYCQHCKKTVNWYIYNNQSELNTGHYYLISDVYAQIRPQENKKVCIDLNGYTVKGEKRALYAPDNCNAVISIMDTSAAQTGKILGCGSNVGAAIGYGGATAFIGSTNSVNLYGGTLGAYERENRSVTFAGVALIYGEFNMYGGTIDGGTVSSFTGQYISSNQPVTVTKTANSATVCVYPNATFRMYGGEVKNGQFQKITGIVSSTSGGYVYSQTVKTGTGQEPCINAYGNVVLAGDAKVDNIYFTRDSASRLMIDTSAEPFTGSVTLTLPLLTDTTLSIGTCTPGTVLQQDAVTVTNSDSTVAIDGDQLKVVANTVDIYNADGYVSAYASLNAAMNAYAYDAQAGNYIKLSQDVTDAVSVTGKTVYLDLNGFDISGNITVGNNAVLYCMDSKTDDYTVLDKDYGKLTGTCTGTISAVPANTVSAAQGNFRDAYLAVQETDGLSFHRIRVQISMLSLRPGRVGMYYTGAFSGDELVATEVDEFGIALSLLDKPGVNDDNSLWVAKDGADWTNSGTVSSVMLENVMKASCTDEENLERSAMPLFVSAYISTDQGVFYSDLVGYSLEQLVETADATNVIQGAGLEGVIAMYNKYKIVMDQWQIPNVQKEMLARENVAYAQNKVHLAAEKMTTDKVFAAGGTVTADCPVCGTQVQWTDLNVLGATTVDTDGHYYLSGNLSNANGYIFKANACLHLNGHNITASSKAAIYVNAKDSKTPYILNIMGKGVVSGKGIANSTINRGGAIDNSGNVNLYGGTYKSSNDMPVICGRGWNLYSDMSVYDGAEIISEATYTEPTIVMRATDVFVYGGTITGGNGHAIKTSGGYANTLITGGTITNGSTDVYTVYVGLPATDATTGAVTAKNVTVDITGGTITGGGVFVDANVKTLSASGRCVISKLDLTNGKLLILGEMKKGAEIFVEAEGAITGTLANAEAYLNFIKPFTDGYEVAVVSNALVVRDWSATRNNVYLAAKQMTADDVFAAGGELTAECPVCEKEVVWTELNTIDSMTGIPAGHYYLSESVENTTWYSFSGDVCLHLNGCDITSSSKALLINAPDEDTVYVLNVMGEGTVTGAGIANSTINRGGALDIAGRANLFGGTYKCSNEMPIISGRGWGAKSYLNIYDGAEILGDESHNMPSIVIRSCDVGVYGGLISGGKGGNIYASGGYALIGIYGGIIENGGAAVGGNIYAATSKTAVDIAGGIIRNGSVYVASDAKYVKVSGKPTVSELDLTSGMQLTLGQMKEGAEIYVTAADGAFTVANKAAASYVGYFKAAQSGKIVKAENDTLVIANA